MNGIFNMTNLNAPAKSRGVVLFAFNTCTVDYVKIAEQSAKLIKHYLQLPITLITDTLIESTQFDQIICVENNLENIRIGHAHGELWRNGERYRAYEFSPYDETILLDTDYLVLDRSLLKLFDQTYDYKLMYNNHMINEPNNNFTMGMLNLPYVWATVIIFKKTIRAKHLFEVVGKIQRNYNYYRKLYQLNLRNFRNDYAFAMANLIVNGYDLGIEQSIPTTMLTIDKSISKLEIKDGSIVVRQEQHAHVIPKQNIHIMDKQYLLSDDFNNFVGTLCQG